jgi:hypothetical protein
VTEHLDELSVYERSTDSFRFENPRIQVMKCTVLGIDYESHNIFVKGIDTPLENKSNLKPD